MLVAVLVTVTLAPGRTAPVESVIVPVMVPRMVCAAIGDAVTLAASRTVATAAARMIWACPERAEQSRRVEGLKIMVPPGVYAMRLLIYQFQRVGLWHFGPWEVKTGIECRPHMSSRRRPRSTTLADAAYFVVREDILRGQRRPGMPVSRRRLARELGMSVVPVTDALKRLEEDGLLETRARAGTRVRVPSETDVRELYEL